MLIIILISLVYKKLTIFKRDSIVMPRNALKTRVVIDIFLKRDEGWWNSLKNL